MRRLLIRDGCLGWSILALVCLAAPSVSAQSEDQVKAAFLFNFARYVEWPAEAFEGSGAAITICVLGDEGFEEIVASTVAGKRVGERPVEVASSVEDFARCHLAYVGDDEADVPAILARLDGRSVLTVADRAGFAAAGGIANFFRADNKIRFEINPGAAKRAGLKIRSSLLRLARVVSS